MTNLFDIFRYSRTINKKIRVFFSTRPLFDIIGFINWNWSNNFIRFPRNWCFNLPLHPNKKINLFYYFCFFFKYKNVYFWFTLYRVIKKIDKNDSFFTRRQNVCCLPPTKIPLYATEGEGVRVARERKTARYARRVVPRNRFRSRPYSNPPTRVSIKHVPRRVGQDVTAVAGDTPGPR